MHPYIVESMAREQLNDRLAKAAGARAQAAAGTRPSYRAQRRVARTPIVPRPRRDLANQVRHPVGAFRSWLAAGQL